MNNLSPSLRLRNTRAFIAAFITYVMLAGQVAPLLLTRLFTIMRHRVVLGSFAIAGLLLSASVFRQYAQSNLPASVPSFASDRTLSSASEQVAESARKQNTIAEAKRSAVAVEPEISVHIARARVQGSGVLKRHGALRISAGEEHESAAGSPRAALAADFDADGVNDLLVAHNDRLVLHRGNINAFAPQTQAAWEAIRDGRFVQPFERKTRTFNVPAAADFIFAGDFNRDARLDAAFASRGDNSLYILEGDGAGRFPNLRRIETAGTITSVASGDVNRADGLPDLIVGTRGADGFGLQIFSGLGDIFAASPLSFNLPSQAEAIAVGQLNENEFADIAVGTDSEVIILSGSDSTQIHDEPIPENVHLPQPAGVKSIVTGDLMPDRDNRTELAVLSPDGSVRIFARGSLDTRPVSVNEHLAEQVREYQAKGYPIPQRILKRLSKSDLRKPLPSRQSDVTTWAEAETVMAAAPNLQLSAQSVLTTGRLSNGAADDLIVLDQSNNKVLVMPFELDYSEIDRQNTRLSFEGRRAMQGFEVPGPPVAALALKLNFDNDADLLVLQEGSGSPLGIISAAAATFTVTTAVDDIDNNLGNGVCNGPSGCTLRAAIMETNRLAGDDVIMINPGINPTISRGQPDNDGQGTNDQASGDLDITCVISSPAFGSCDFPIPTTAANQNDLSIIGAAGGNTVSAGTFTPYPVDGGGSINTDRVFDVGQDGTTGGGFGGSTGVSVTFTNLTIQNGNVREALNTALGGGNRAFGGGIRYDGFGNASTHGSLTLMNTTINNNQADNAGGGVYHVFGAHTSSTVTYTSNITKAGEGGGLFFGAATSNSNVSISSSTFTANEARQGVVFGLFTANADGGGLRINADPNTVTINSTNFTNNIAQQDAGAIKTLGAQVTVTGGTMTGNTARRHGGVAFGDEDTANSPAFVTFSGSTMRNNTANSDNAIFAGDGSAGDGGAIFRDRGTLNITNSTIGGTGALEPNTATNGGGVAHAFTVDSAAGNTSNQTIVTINGGSINGNVANTDGGGVYFNSQLFDVAAGTLNIGQTTATALTGNKAKNNGGGIHTSNGATANLEDMTLRSNQANSDGSAGGDGGALFQNTGTTTFTGTLVIGGSGFANSAVNGGGISNAAGTLTIPTNASITFNTATGNGGGINNGGTINNFTNATITNNSASSGGAFFISGGTLSTSLSYINSNTATTGSGITRTGGTATVENNWWGCDGFPNAAGCQTGSGTFDADPRIDLRLSAAPTSVLLGGTSTLTADITKNTDNANTNGGNAPSVLVGRNFVFDGGAKGTINPPLTVAIPADGTETKTFTANANSAACGAATPSVMLDAGPQTVSITVQCPDLTMTKTNNVAGSAVVGQQWTWTLTVANAGVANANAVFTSGQTVLTDSLPNSANISYGSPTSSNANVTCTINGTKDLSCTAPTGVTLAPAASFTVQFTATATAPATYANPRVVGGAQVDPNNNVVESDEGNNGASNSVVVTKANTSVALTSSQDPSVFGQSVTFTATVAVVSPGAGTPTGTVNFLDGGNPITGCQNVALTALQAQCITSALSVGNHTISAAYSGDDNFNTSTGNLTGNPQVVNKADTSVGLTSSLNPAVFGQPVTFTATVGVTAPGAGSPTGTVSFLDGGNPITGCTSVALQSGQAQCQPGSISVGNHTISAQYSGDGSFNTSTGNMTGNPQVVNKADTTVGLTSSQNPSTFGQQVTFTATIAVTAPGAGAPTGTVQFLDGGNPITGCGSASITGGQATCQTSALSVGDHTITAQYSGDGSFNTSTGSLTGNPQVVIQPPLDISARDAKVAEPVSPNTTNMVFTVTLSAPASGPVSVNFTTADEAPGAGKAVSGGCPGFDYTTTSGTLSFIAGQQVKTISVPVCSDSDTEPDETFLLNLSGASGGTIQDSQAVGTITVANPAGTILISELRTFGPGAGNDPNDEFVEVYNNSNSPVTVAASDASAGFALVRMGATCADTPVVLGVIPNGTVIPARGHFLFVGSAYSLTAYAGGNLTMTSDIPANGNVGLFNTANVANLSTATRLDAVGFGTNTSNNCDLLREGGAAPALTSNLTSLGQHSFVRDLCGKGASSGASGPCPAQGNPQDGNNNASDFYFVDANGTNTGAGSHLGAPGPENLASPIRRDTSGIGLPLLDASKSASAVPNRVRDFTSDPPNNSTFGTLSIRRRVVNNTGAAVTRLRFRIIDMTTFPAPGGIADLRARTSSSVTVTGVTDAATCAANGVPATSPCTVTVQGTTLEVPPAQPNGGGTNSSLAAGTVTLGTPLANGASVSLQFLLGVQQTGTFRFVLIIEALP